jgi:hypothetical protein
MTRKATKTAAMTGAIAANVDLFSLIAFMVIALVQGALAFDGKAPSKRMT